MRNLISSIEKFLKCEEQFAVGLVRIVYCKKRFERRLITYLNANVAQTTNFKELIDFARAHIVFVVY